MALSGTQLWKVDDPHYTRMPPRCKPKGQTYGIREAPRGGCSAVACPTASVALRPTGCFREASRPTTKALNGGEGATGANATGSLVATGTAHSTCQTRRPIPKTAESRHVCTVTCATISHVTDLLWSSCLHLFRCQARLMSPWYRTCFGYRRSSLVIERGGVFFRCGLLA